MFKSFFYLRNSVFLLTLLTMILIAHQSYGEEALATTRTLEKLVSQWVELKQQISEEEQAWKEEAAQLHNERKLLTKEKHVLEAEIAHLRKSKTTHDARRLQLLEAKQKYQAVLEDSLFVLRQAEANLRHWRKRLPPPLLIPLEKYFNQLGDGAEKTVSQRLQTILALYTQIEKYQSSINVGKQVIPINNKESLEFDVLYIGLAQGYCVSQNSRYAGIGRPELTGWEWEWRPELATRIKQSIELYSREKIAAFITLPLRVQKD